MWASCRQVRVRCVPSSLCRVPSDSVVIEVNPETGLTRCKLGAQGQFGNAVVTGILFAERNGGRRPERIEALTQGLADLLEARLVDLSDTIDDMRRQHVEAGIEQQTMLDGEQQIVDGTVDAA